MEALKVPLKDPLFGIPLKERLKESSGLVDDTFKEPF